jgi:hypothetical protein
LYVTFSCSFQNAEACAEGIQLLWANGFHVRRVANTVSIVCASKKAESGRKLLEKLQAVPATPVADESATIPTVEEVLNGDQGVSPTGLEEPGSAPGEN